MCKRADVAITREYHDGMMHVVKRVESGEFSLAKQASSHKVEAFENSGRAQAARTCVG